MRSAALSSSVTEMCSFLESGSVVMVMHPSVHLPYSICKKIPRCNIHRFLSPCVFNVQSIFFSTYPYLHSTMLPFRPTNFWSSLSFRCSKLKAFIKHTVFGQKVASFHNSFTKSSHLYPFRLLFVNHKAGNLCSCPLIRASTKVACFVTHIHQVILLHDKWSATVSPWTAINPWLPLSPFIWLRNKGLHYVHRNLAKRRHFSRFFHKILTSKALSKSIHPTLYVHSTLWDSTKKADRLSTYRLFVCLYSTFDSSYYSTDSLTMQCVFSPI